MKACRNCRLLVEKESKCPLCNSEDLTGDYAGMLIIIDPARSEIAKNLNITSPGKYAVNIK